MKEPTDFDIGYLAGIIDGEGSIGIMDVRGTYCISVRISQQESRKAILRRIQDFWGGKLYLEKREGYMDCFSLSWYGQNTRAILETVRSHVIGKRDHVNLGMQFLDLMPGKGGQRGLPRGSSTQPKHEMKLIKHKMSRLNKGMCMETEDGPCMFLYTSVDPLPEQAILS